METIRSNTPGTAASQSLSRLRATFGEEVYVRQGNAYRLTSHGERVIGGIRTIVKRWNESLQAVQGFDPSESAMRFNVACVGHSALPDFVQLQADLREQAPGARLDLQVPLYNAVDFQLLRAGRLDVLCASAPPPADARDMRHELLCSHALTHVLLSKSHPRVGDRISLAQDLAEDHVVAHYRNIERNFLDQALRQHLSPTKVNIAALGNMVPHLHWHLVARFEGDSQFPAPIWAPAQREPAPDALAVLSSKLPALDQALASTFH